MYAVNCFIKYTKSKCELLSQTIRSFRLHSCSTERNLVQLDFRLVYGKDH
jgi:hypothetical protein